MGAAGGPSFVVVCVAAPRRWRCLGQPLFCARGSFQTRRLVGSVRGERSEPMPLAACSRGPRGQHRQSLIALASRCSNVRECVACPGPGSPRCASRRVRSRPYAVGGGGGGSACGFEQRHRRRSPPPRGTGEVDICDLPLHAIDAMSVESNTHRLHGSSLPGFGTGFAQTLQCNRRAGVVSRLVLSNRPKV